jgi:hypothetical protein
MVWKLLPQFIEPGGDGNVKEEFLQTDDDPPEPPSGGVTYWSGGAPGCQRVLVVDAMYDVAEARKLRDYLDRVLPPDNSREGQ